MLETTPLSRRRSRRRYSCTSQNNYREIYAACLATPYTPFTTPFGVDLFTLTDVLSGLENRDKTCQMDHWKCFCRRLERPLFLQLSNEMVVETREISTCWIYFQSLRENLVMGLRRNIIISYFKNYKSSGLWTLKKCIYQIILNINIFVKTEYIILFHVCCFDINFTKVFCVITLK